MKTNLILLFGLLLLSACKADKADAELRQNPADNVSEPAPAAAPEQEAVSTRVVSVDGISADDRTYVPNERFGKITANTTPEQLVEYYGEENVKKDSIHLGEGYYLAGYKLFPGTPSEASLLFPGGKAQLRDMQVTVDLTATDWKAAQTGIKIGTSMEELERLNGGPFSFYGFEWDYAGAVTDWKGGALKDYRLRVSYDFENRKNTVLHPSIRGEQETSSENPALKGLEVKVIQIIVRLPVLEE